MENFTQSLITGLLDIAAVTVLSLASYLAVQLINFVKLKVNSTTLEKLLDEENIKELIAEQVVRLLEQVPWAQEWSNEEKKTYAMGRVQEILRNAGFDVDAVSVDQVIEAKVHQIKNSVY